MDKAMTQLSLRPNQSVIEGIEFKQSPNYDERPDGVVDLLVIHCISLPPKQFGGPHIEKFFLNQLDVQVHPYFQTIKTLRVSSHLLIRRAGELMQFVPFGKRAWHAGLSEFRGREECNDFSIGIELEGAEDIAYSEQQYQKLAQCTKFLMRHYPKISSDRIVGHSDIAPGRKTDPGPSFDWTYFKTLI